MTQRSIDSIRHAWLMWHEWEDDNEELIPSTQIIHEAIDELALLRESVTGLREALTAQGRFFGKVFHVDTCNAWPSDDPEAHCSPRCKQARRALAPLAEEPK